MNNPEHRYDYVDEEGVNRSFTIISLSRKEAMEYLNSLRGNGKIKIRSLKSEDKTLWSQYGRF